MFKFFWHTHKWLGILFSIVFLNVAVTGLLLLVKKDVHWIQPPTRNGAEGDAASYISMEKLMDVVLAQKHEDFKAVEDIDRVDFRVGKRVHKVRSVRNNAEIQVCAVTGKVLSVSTRPSDWLESLHDGSFFGKWAHGYVMPVTALVTVFLVISGLYLWLVPAFKRKARRA